MDACRLSDQGRSGGLWRELLLEISGPSASCCFRQRHSGADHSERAGTLTMSRWASQIFLQLDACPVWSRQLAAPHDARQARGLPLRRRLGEFSVLFNYGRKVTPSSMTSTATSASPRMKPKLGAVRRFDIPAKNIAVQCGDSMPAVHTDRLATRMNTRTGSRTF